VSTSAILPGAGSPAEADLGQASPIVAGLLGARQDGWVSDPEQVPDVRLNAVGDVILDDVRQLEALADPGRLVVFEWLQRHGASTVGELCEAVGREPAALTASLALLEAAGLVRQESGGWRALGRGLFLQLPDDDPEAASAARSLANVMLLAAAEVPARWVAEVEPRLDARWAGAAGLFGARPTITASELMDIQQALEDLLEPYLNRDPSEVPDGARRVRLQAFFLPADA
jgi:DNA-binding transcriptional ArsR family regulator